MLKKRKHFLVEQSQEVKKNYILNDYTELAALFGAISFKFWRPSVDYESFFTKVPVGGKHRLPAHTTDFLMSLPERALRKKEQGFASETWGHAIGFVYIPQSFFKYRKTFIFPFMNTMSEPKWTRYCWSQTKEQKMFNDATSKSFWRIRNINWGTSSMIDALYFGFSAPLDFLSSKEATFYYLHDPVITNFFYTGISSEIDESLGFFLDDNEYDDYTWDTDHEFLKVNVDFIRADYTYLKPHLCIL